MIQIHRLRRYFIPLTILYSFFLASTVNGQENDRESSNTKQQTPSAESAQAEQSGEPVDGNEEFTWSLGAGVIVSPRPYVGADARVIPIPSLEIRYRNWFFQGIRGGYSFIDSEPFTANFFAQAQFRGLDSEDSPFLEGMETRSRSMDAGGEFLCSTRPVGFRASFISDILNRSNGQELALLAITGAPLGGRGVILFGIGPKFLSQNRTDYYYGVRLSESTLTRPAYSAPATWNLEINITGIVNFGSKWRLFAMMDRESFGSGIEDSPLIDQTSSYSFISSLNYRF